jgi:hypothetical protein
MKIKNIIPLLFLPLLIFGQNKVTYIGGTAGNPVLVNVTADDTTRWASGASGDYDTIGIVTDVDLSAGVVTSINTGQSTSIPKVISVQDTLYNELVDDIFVVGYNLSTTWYIKIYSSTAYDSLTVYYIKDDAGQGGGGGGTSYNRDSVYAYVVDSSLINRTELGDTAAAIRADFPAGGGNITSAVAQNLNTLIDNGLMIVRYDSVYASDSAKWENGELIVIGAVNITDGASNINIGENNPQGITTGNDNISIGDYPLFANQSGDFNVAIGYASMSQGTGMTSNTGIGTQSLRNVTGDYNTAVGVDALFSLTSGANNIAIGYHSARYLTTESNRIVINSLGRTNKLGDTTLSPIYIYQAATTANQQLYFNGNVNISDDLTVDRNTILGENTDDSTLISGKLYAGNMVFDPTYAEDDGGIVLKDGVNFNIGYINDLDNADNLFQVLYDQGGNNNILLYYDDPLIAINIQNSDSTITIKGNYIKFIDINSNDTVTIRDGTIGVENNANIGNNLTVGSNALMCGSLNDSVYIKGYLYVDGHINRTHYNAAAYLDPDSTITTSVTTSWIYLGDGANNKFSNLESVGFSFDGDTLQFDQDTEDLRDSIKFEISYGCESSASSNNMTVYNGIFIKSTGDSDYVEKRWLTKRSRLIASGTYYAGPTCTSMPIWLKDGDKIQIRAKGGDTYTLSTQSFGIYLVEK